VESTVYRFLDTLAFIVGGPPDIAAKCSDVFENAQIRVNRVAHAAAACERLPIAMPQMVVVIGALRQDERDALVDRATAVGALLFDLDPELDTETLDMLLDRAAHAAIERGLSRDAPATRPEDGTE
jgi:hypothetical protein